MDGTTIIFLIIGAIVGAAIIYALQANRQKALSNSLSAEEAKSKELEKSLEQSDSRLKGLQQENKEALSDLATAQANLNNLNEKLETQKQELLETKEELNKEFKLLANQIFEEKTQKFTEQNKTNLDGLLNPLKERIQEFQKKVEDSNLQGEKRTASLKEQLTNLKELNQEITKEAKSLTQALRGDSKTQGNWGEFQLEGILEKAGLQKDVHYSKEQNYKTEDGSNQRLDYIINLPDGKHLILDSKVSLAAYSRYFDTEDEGVRVLELKNHLNSIYTHIKTLGDKNYQSLYSINTPDFILMFLANEPALSIALQEDQSLFEKALDKNIVLVSASTLLATLRTIAYIWKQDQQNKNADEIARQAGGLYDKFVGFTEDLIKLGSQMKTAQKTYDESMKKLTDGTGNLVRRTERLKELGTNPTKGIDQRLIDRSEGD